MKKIRRFLLHTLITKNTFTVISVISIKLFLKRNLDFYKCFNNSIMTEIRAIVSIRIHYSLQSTVITVFFSFLSVLFWNFYPPSENVDEIYLLNFMNSIPLPPSLWATSAATPSGVIYCCPFLSIKLQTYQNHSKD